MNHYYRVVFNQTLGVMQAVPELSRMRGKAGKSPVSHTERFLKRSTAIAALALGLAPGLATANTLGNGGNGAPFASLGAHGPQQHWQGGDGTWNDTNLSWRNDGAGTPVVWSGHEAVFKDTGSHMGATISVEGTQSFEGLQFVDNGYRLQGTGSLETVTGGSEIRMLADQAHIATQITGAGGITKTQEGTVALSGANTYAGGTRLEGGVLSVASDANLGHADGPLTFNGGTLRITDSNFGETGRAVTLGEKGGGFDMEFNSLDEETVTFSGNLGGAGDLTKLGRGNLRLTGDNAYGNTIVREGELIGNSRSISGNILIADDDTAAVTFVEEHDARFAGNITGAPSPYASLIKEGAGLLTLTGTSTLNWYIHEGGLITSADRFRGYAATGADGSITFNEAGDATLISALQGEGLVHKTGEGTLRLPGDSGGFAGHTTVHEGTLSVGGADGAGRLGGTLTVADGGALSGTGQVGTTTIQSGGTVAPGNSIGILTVTGDLTFEPGSRYDVEVSPDGPDSDLIRVAGTASLQGGSVIHVGANGLYAPDSSYRVLSADTALTGAFDQVTSNLAFLTPSLAYDYENHTIDLRLQLNGSSFESLAHTPNQRATAYGLSSLPSGNALYQRILNLPEGAPAGVFDSLSGEVHASLMSAVQAGSNTIRSRPLSHMRKNLAAGLLPGAPLAQANTSTLPASSLPQSAARPLWAEVAGNWQTLTSDGNAASLKQSTGGVFVGGDYHVGAGWRIGAALGFTDAKLRIDDRDSKADITTYSAALYAGKTYALDTGGLNLMLGGAYSRHDIDSRRHATVADWRHTLKADYRAHTSQVFGELGYALPVGQATIEPFAGLAWINTRARGFEESGGPTALSASSQSYDTTAGTLGLRASTGFELGQTQGRLHASVAWRHAFGNLAPRRTLAFEGSQQFAVAGAPIARNAALVELAADVSLSANATAGLSYGAQLGGGNREHAAKVNVQWRF
ncbi:autotransporter domain-containing protein [Pusillimonas sp.]|uniref:autotransporter domain-containing protein n=1 Tax=Pusillimonas sp. TaxID=3040095 RepID=UPI0037C8C487